MEAILDPIFRREVDAGSIPGAAAIVLDASGNTLFSKGYGSTKVDDPNAPSVTVNTPATMYSCTKLLTAVAALQLVEQGKLDLDALAEEHVPGIKDIELLKGFGEDGKPILKTPEKKISVTHLLTHTAGFTYDFFDKPTMQWRLAVGQSPMPYAVTAAKQDFTTPLVSEPGTQYVYGINMDWIAFVVEKITGLRIDEYVKQHIAGPLGLSTIVGDLSEEQDKVALNIHVQGPEGKLMSTPLRLPKDPEVMSGGHGLYGSCADYAQFLLTLLNNGTHPQSKVKILEPDTVKQHIFTDWLPKVGASSDLVGEVTASVPQASYEGTLLPGVKKGWSLGGLVNLEDAPNGRKAGSLAWAGLSNTYYWIDSTEGKLGCVFSAMLPFMSKDVLHLFDAVERAAYGKPQARVAGEKGSNFEMKA